MSATGNADDLFREAARDFRDSLSPSDSKELVEFSSAHEMIQELKTRASSYQNKSTLVGFCQRLERVSKSLSPFFDVIGIFIQSNPEVPALVWGAMRMVFLLASNFSSFLDKLLVMFEKISDLLPGYAEHYGRLLTRIPGCDSTRVRQALLHIYKDLLLFCQEACKIFGTKKRGTRWKAAAVADIFWKPFNVRFQDILERIQTHQDLFLREMQLEESKYTEEQFRAIKNGLKSNNEAIAGITKHLNDVNPARASSMFDVTFRRVVKWINASDFSRNLNNARKVRMDNTGKWFLASPYYKEFKSLQTTPLAEGCEPPKMQITLIQAKPGYGKTILSSLLIADLAQPPKLNRPGELQTSPTVIVLYYHFTADNVEECSSTHGLRACLHQIIHYNMKIGDMLDAVSIIMETDNTGQIKATDEDIRQCLLLFLTFLTPVIMVFDGFDECTDPSDLFRTVHELCCHTGAKAIFLGRPSCKPPRSCKSYTVISLDPSQNANDIQSYLQPEIERLNNDDLFPKSSNIEEIVTILTCRAQGMFLWARLVVLYLSHAWLSPSERLHAIFDDTLLNGLENLYGKIIAALERGHPAQQEKVHRIFQVMAISRSPFTLFELRQIVAVKLGRVTREEDLIVNFQDCLPVLCGALVECDIRGHVRFIHFSFREYISTSQYLHDSRLAITKQSSWLSLTAICLSYLTYDIPRAAMSSNAPSNSQLAMIERCFPLLRYGVNRVQEHGYGIFRNDIPTSKDELDRASAVLQALEEWINQRLCVTAWIEATFFFQQLPFLEPLITMIEIWRLRYETHRARADKILSLYRQLEQNLTELRNDWAQVLLNEPSAVWTSTVTAFNKSSFWQTKNDTIVTYLGEQPRSPMGGDRMENRDSAMILIKSQTAADKMTNGLLYVIPSSQYVTATETAGHLIHTPVFRMDPKLIKYVSSGWKAQYQIRDISSQVMLISVKVDLPTSDVSDVLMKLDEPSKGSSLLRRFSFPVSISADLDIVLILRTLVSLRLGTATPGERQSGTYAIYFQQLRSQTMESEPRIMSDYKSMFSPMHDAVAFLEKTGTSTAPARAIEIWSRTTSIPSGLAKQYSCRGRQSFGLQQLQVGRKLLLFHPSRPCLVFTKWNESSIWWYNENYESLSRCYAFVRGPIVPVSFGPDTCLCHVELGVLCGRIPDRLASQAGFLGESTKTIIIPTRKEITKPCERSPVASDHRSSDNTAITRRHRGSLTITKHGETFSATQDVRTNNVVNITSTDGRTARFGHLPSLPSPSPSSVTLLSIASSVKVVWNKELQNDYSVLDTQSRHIPCVIERTLQPFPLLEQARSQSSGMSVTTDSDGQSGNSQLTKKRHRAVDDNSGEEPKKHATMRTVAKITERDDAS